MSNKKRLQFKLDSKHQKLTKIYEKPKLSKEKNKINFFIFPMPFICI